MSRRIELIAALIACALGLIWLADEATTLQSLWSMGALVGSGHTSSQPIGTNGTGVYFMAMAIVMMGIALGAYLHTVQRFPLGLILLWATSVIAGIAIAVYLIAPWQFVPIQFIYILQGATYIWLTPLGVLSVVFAWIAAIAGLPIRQGVASSTRARHPARQSQGSRQVPTQ